MLDTERLIDDLVYRQKKTHLRDILCISFWLNAFGKDGGWSITRYQSLRPSDCLTVHLVCVMSNDPAYGTQGKFNQLNNLCFLVLNTNICITGQVIPRLLGNLACLTDTVTDSHVDG